MQMALISAIQMLIIVVAVWLLANLLQLCITLMEYACPEVLDETEFTAKMYELSADFVSLFTVLASALRPAIYCYCNEELRRAVIGIVSLIFIKKIVQIPLFVRIIRGHEWNNVDKLGRINFERIGNLILLNMTMTGWMCNIYNLI
jgi:hypothetical protein